MFSRKANQNDYKEIMNIWEESVLATHSFLKEKDREDIKKEIPSYFPHLDIQLWCEGDETVGFSGIQGQHLEMLFLHPNKIGKGFGSSIITSLINDFNVTTVDVNKDNEQAVKFYMKNGFYVANQSGFDASGRPYPILNLRLK